MQDSCTFATNTIAINKNRQGTTMPQITILAAALLVLTLAGCDKQPEVNSAALQAYTAEQQQTLQQGRIKARSCTACHGINGVSRLAMYPSLAGRPQAELAQALQEYKNGIRTNALMSPQARGLADDDIELLAAYFSLLPKATE